MWVTHVTVRISGLFLFITEQYSVVWRGRHLFIQAPVQWHLSSFQFMTNHVLYGNCWPAWALDALLLPLSAQPHPCPPCPAAVRDQTLGFLSTSPCGSLSPLHSAPVPPASSSLYRAEIDHSICDSELQIFPLVYRGRTLPSLGLCSFVCKMRGLGYTSSTFPASSGSMIIIWGSKWFCRRKYSQLQPSHIYLSECRGTRTADFVTLFSRGLRFAFLEQDFLSLQPQLVPLFILVTVLGPLLPSFLNMPTSLVPQGFCMCQSWFPECSFSCKSWFLFVIWISLKDHLLRAAFPEQPPKGLLPPSPQLSCTCSPFIPALLSESTV